MNKNNVLKGLLLIVFATIFGAFGAHYLESNLEPKQLVGFKTGVTYQFYGGLVLLSLGINLKQLKFSTTLPLNLFFLGILLFSFSIYILTLFRSNSIAQYLGPITPIGGLLMIVSLFILIYRIWKSKN